MAAFDLAKTNALLELFAHPRDLRDDAWRAAFKEAVIDASLASPKEQVMRGPDGFPYFVLTRPPVAEEFTPFCISHVLGHCTSSGIGIVIEPGEKGPEWVFSYGDLFSLRAYGSFAGDPVDQDAPGPKIEVLEKDRHVMVGSPSEEFFPAWARRVLSGFLKSAANIETPGVLVMVDPTRAPSRNLVFNVHPEDFESQADFQKIMNMLGWFMPPKRSCIALSKGALDPSQFQPL
ncbi:MAG: hypothetical protein ABI461_11815 [Polyangiaceae bacterium]